MKKDQAVLWQRAEGVAILIASVWCFDQLSGNWWLFGLLLLFVDIFMLGYLLNPKIGAIAYNAGHSIIVPIILLIFWHDGGLVTQLSIIWLAHIGMDRMFGYGLKFTSSFKDTILGKIGGA